jgi:dynactin complex subunit
MASLEAIEVDLKNVKENLAELTLDIKNLNKLILEQADLKNQISNVTRDVELVKNDNDKQWKIVRDLTSDIQTLKNTPASFKASVFDQVWRWVVTAIGAIFIAKLTGMID